VICTLDKLNQISSSSIWSIPNRDHHVLSRYPTIALLAIAE
jgi:hypothetical protein